MRYQWPHITAPGWYLNSIKCELILEGDLAMTPYGQVFLQWKKIKNLVSPICVSTSGQQKYASPSSNKPMVTYLPRVDRKPFWKIWGRGVLMCYFIRYTYNNYCCYIADVVKSLSYVVSNDFHRFVLNSWTGTFTQIIPIVAYDQNFHWIANMYVAEPDNHFNDTTCSRHVLGVSKMRSGSTEIFY